MSRPRPEPLQAVTERRDRTLGKLTGMIAFSRFLGVDFDRRGDELTAVMHYGDHLIGNPVLPALHGGATAAFLELTALIQLSWVAIWPRIEAGELTPDELDPTTNARLPKTIDFTVDYLRSGLPRDAYAWAHVNRSGRRYASVHVEAWQDNRARPFAQATGHFLMPEPGG